MGTPRSLAVAAVAALVLAACTLGRSEPLSFFTLTPTVEPMPAASSGPPGIVAVQTVRLPEYLNQKAIVTRTRGNQLMVAGDANWAGAFDDNITNVLVENLSRLLGGTQVVALPVSAALPIQQLVQTDISRFEASVAGDVELAARWLVFSDGGRRFQSTHSATLVTTVPAGAEYEAIAAAMSRLLGDFARQVATSLIGAPEGLRTAR